LVFVPSISIANPTRLAHNLVTGHNHHHHHQRMNLFLSTLLDALLARIQWTFSFGFVGHIFSCFGI
jgi:hypothetical protein